MIRHRESSTSTITSWPRVKRQCLAKGVAMGDLRAERALYPCLDSGSKSGRRYLTYLGRKLETQEVARRGDQK